MASAGVFGAPAGAKEGPWFSPALPAGAPAPSLDELKLSVLTDRFIYVERTCSAAALKKTPALGLARFHSKTAVSSAKQRKLREEETVFIKR